MCSNSFLKIVRNMNKYAAFSKLRLLPLSSVTKG